MRPANQLCRWGFVCVCLLLPQPASAADKLGVFATCEIDRGAFKVEFQNLGSAPARCNFLCWGKNSAGKHTSYHGTVIVPGGSNKNLRSQNVTLQVIEYFSRTCS